MTSLSSTADAIGSKGLSRVPLWVLLLGPYLTFLVLALLLPIIYLGAISIHTYSAQKIWSNVLTGANYAKLFDEYYADVLLRTLRIGLVTTFLCTLLGAPLAYWLGRCSRKMLAIGLFLVVVPMMVSTVIRAFGWMILLGRNGLINQATMQLGLGRWLTIMNTEPAVVIALIQICLPLMVLPTMAAIEKIPITLEEAATNLGAGPLQLFRRILLPLASPGLASGALLCFVVAISVVVTPALMGGRANRMVGNEIYDQVITAMNWPFASAMAVILIVIVIFLLASSVACGRYLERQAHVRYPAQGA